jgi:hypothetical protein
LVDPPHSGFHLLPDENHLMADLVDRLLFSHTSLDTILLSKYLCGDARVQFSDIVVAEVALV